MPWDLRVSQAVRSHDLGRVTVAVVSVLLGIACWFLGLVVRPGPTPLAGGAYYILILATAGFVVAILERGLSWTSLAGLYAGQLIAFGVRALFGHIDRGDEPVWWQPIFILSFILAAALGGALGAALWQIWRSRAQPS